MVGGLSGTLKLNCGDDLAVLWDAVSLLTFEIDDIGRGRLLPLLEGRKELEDDIEGAGEGARREACEEGRRGGAGLIGSPKSVRIVIALAQSASFSNRI